MDTFTFYINCFLSMGLFLIIIYIIYNSYKNDDQSNSNLFESFNDFSPYANNQDLKYHLYKKIDQQLLERTRNLWENHEEGYYNADFGGVPLVPITLFDSYKKV